MREKLNDKFIKFGYLPFLYLLDEFETQERYEECAIIDTFLKEKSEIYGFKYPMNYESAIDGVRQTLRELSSNGGKVWFVNFPAYVEELEALFNES